MSAHNLCIVFRGALLKKPRVASGQAELTSLSGMFPLSLSLSLSPLHHAKAEGEINPI